jgi:hypothetical protein
MTYNTDGMKHNIRKVPPYNLIETIPNSFEELEQLVLQQPRLLPGTDSSWFYQLVSFKNPYKDIVYGIKKGGTDSTRSPLRWDFWSLLYFTEGTCWSVNYSDKGEAAYKDWVLLLSKP